MDLATPALPADLLNPVRAPSANGANTPAAIRKVAEEFEASFLQAMLQPMFNALSTDGPTGGGQGEAAYKSFMVDAMTKQMARSGGIGLADSVMRQMLQMQGLSPTGAPLAAPGAATPGAASPNAAAPVPVEEAA